MTLSDLARRSFALQNLVTKIVCGLPAPIAHNIEKLAAIRKAFAYTGVEGIPGDYLEFGTFEGTSLIGAVNAFQPLDRDDRCRFFGFDSFEGFRLDDRHDPAHPLFKEKEFATSYERVARRVSKYSTKHEVRLVRGYFADTLTRANFEKLAIERIRVSLIDCDLMSSARLALWSSARCWQPGTTLVIDDWFNYRGDPAAGVSGAFEEFGRAHPEVRYRDLGFYGTGGIIRIVQSPPMMRPDEWL